MIKKITDERLLASMAIKDKIISILKDQPMSYTELLDVLNVDKGQLTNHMVQLKKHGFVDYHPDDKPSFKMTRRYVAIDGMGSYYDLMMLKRSKLSENNFKDNSELKFSPYATMKHSSNCKETFEKTKGMRANYKTNAWSGYQANGGL